jgi:hypothetical protein
MGFDWKKKSPFSIYFEFHFGFLLWSIPRIDDAELLNSQKKIFEEKTKRKKISRGNPSRIFESHNQKLKRIRCYPQFEIKEIA